MSPQTSANEIEIRKIIDDWAKAVCSQDHAGIRKDHDDWDILMFDVPSPFQSRGMDAFMATWNLFFGCNEKPMRFDLTDI